MICAVLAAAAADRRLRRLQALLQQLQQFHRADRFDGDHHDDVELGSGHDQDADVRADHQRGQAHDLHSPDHDAAAHDHDHDHDSGSGSASGGVAPQPPAGGGAHRTKVDKPAGGSANARVPATFTISRSGSVSPPTVSAPAFLAISLTVVSGDGKPHQVRLLTLAPHVLHVPAGGRATTLIGGLKAGSYAIQIDGKPKAKLVIGGEPGP